MRVCLIAHSFVMISAVLAFQVEAARIVRRQSTAAGAAAPATPLIPLPPAQTSTATSTTATTPAATTSPAQTTALSTPVAKTSASPASSSPPSTTASTAPTTAAVTSASASGSQTDTALSTAVPTSTTDSAGQQSSASSPSSSPTSSTPPSSSNNPKSSESDSGISTGTIIGLSVAGGIAAIALIAFIIWKVTRTRFADLDTTDPINWPEVNREHTAGESTGRISREASNYSSGALSRDMASEHSDPYAIPPLPQFNPNQPYRDDPYAAATAGYYDPYRGPVPQTLHDDPMESHENIPMNAYPPNPRTRSPGPAMSYDMGGRGSPVTGPMSPGPGLAYNLGDRASPAPGLRMDRRASPGPQYALGGQP